MAFTLVLSRLWAAQGWKVKIRDKERTEPPHVSIIRGRSTWRLGLRSGQLLDSTPTPSEVPGPLLEEIREQFTELRAMWDEMYPHNPVSSE